MDDWLGVAQGGRRLGRRRQLAGDARDMVRLGAHGGWRQRLLATRFQDATKSVDLAQKRVCAAGVCFAFSFLRGHQLHCLLDVSRRDRLSVGVELKQLLASFEPSREAVRRVGVLLRQPCDLKRRLGGLCSLGLSLCERRVKLTPRGEQIVRRGARSLSGALRCGQQRFRLLGARRENLAQHRRGVGNEREARELLRLLHRLAELGALPCEEEALAREAALALELLLQSLLPRRERRFPRADPRDRAEEFLSEWTVLRICLQALHKLR
mmetsp:Transcript_27100/g.62165  ORF Transcript_27100/g.62165 Transcript_27100/m.62165 type:complete len:268 (+) Transcript_27100:1445-2248(+)